MFEHFENGNFGGMGDAMGAHPGQVHEEQIPESPQQVYGTPVYPESHPGQVHEVQMQPHGQGAPPPSRNTPIILGAIGLAAGLALGAMIFRK